MLSAEDKKKAIKTKIKKWILTKYNSHKLIIIAS